MNGRTLGRYEIIEKIDQGGMSEVFRARQLGPHGFEKIVAIKRILPHLVTNHEFIEMFSSEAKVMAQLQHHNIVQIYDFGFEDGHYYIAMEYTHGINLNDFALLINDSRTHIPIPYITWILKNVCNALEHAHTKADSRGKPLRIVHRDVNPKNIMVLFTGEIKLMDFGIALATNRGFETLADGMIKGKISYLSPEQIKSLEIDHRSDLFSLGIVFYELLTGQKPFQADSEFGIMTKISEGQLIPIPRLVKNVPEEIIQIVMKCLARDRMMRYQSATDIRSDIEKYEIRNGINVQQKDFRQYLENVIGVDIISTSETTPSESRAEPTITVSAYPEKDLVSTPPLKKPSRILEDSHPVQPKKSKLPELKISSQPELPALKKATGDASDEMIEPDWDQPKTFFERYRVFLIISFVLLSSAGLAFFVFGWKNMLRITGLYDPVFETVLTISVEPKDALLEVDFIEQKEKPVSLPISWEFGTQHQVKVSHPAYQPIIVPIKVPADSTGQPVFEGSGNPGISIDHNGNNYAILLKMVPNYIKTTIKTKPVGASVIVNDIDTGKMTPLDFDFPTEKESIVRLEKKGYESISTRYRPEPFQKSYLLELTLEKSKVEPETPGQEKTPAVKPPTPTVTPIPATGFVQIKSPFPVEITLNKKKLATGVTTKEIKLPAGKNVLTIKNDSVFYNATKTVTIVKNKTETINIEPTGNMIVESDPPGATITINERSIGTAPGKFELAPGTYNVTFSWQECTATQNIWVRIASQQNKRIPKVTGCR